MMGFGRDELTMMTLMLGFVLTSYAFGYQRAVAEQPLISGVDGLSNLLFGGIALVAVAIASTVFGQKEVT